MFEVETRELMEGMDLRVGIKKGVRIGGVEQNPQALMVIDSKFIKINLENATVV